MSRPSHQVGARGFGLADCLRAAAGTALVLALALALGTGCAVIEAEPHRSPPMELSAVNVDVNLNVQTSDSDVVASWFSDPKLASGLMALAMVQCEDSAGRGLGVADWGLVMVNSSIAMNRALAAEAARSAAEAPQLEAEPAVKVVSRGSRSPGAPDADASAESAGIGDASPFLTSLLVLHERDAAAARDLARDCLSMARGLLLYQRATGNWPLNQAVLDAWIATQPPGTLGGDAGAERESPTRPYAVSWVRGRGDRLQVTMSTGYGPASSPQAARSQYEFLLRPLCLQAFLQRSLDRKVSLRDLPPEDAPASLRGRSVWTALLLQSLVSADSAAQQATPPTP